MINAKDKAILQNYLRTIASAHGMAFLRSNAKDIDFDIKDELNDPRNMAQLRPPNRIDIKKSIFEKEESWELYNILVHELVHYSQSKDPNLAAYFQLLPNGEDSVRVNLLLELDAFVKTQIIMDDLQTAGKVPAPTSDGYINDINTVYQQIKEAGYDHESGEAGRVLFESLVADKDFCAAYLMPRAEWEFGQLEQGNQAVQNDAIQKGELRASDICIDADVPNITHTLLGKLKERNFMVDNEGKADYLFDKRFIKDRLSDEHFSYLTEINARRDKEFEMLKPYLAPAEELPTPRPKTSRTTTAQLY